MTRRRPDGSFAVVVSGELDHRGVEQIENDVRWAVAHAHGSVVLECSDVTFVDSAGLRLIIQAQMMATDRRLRFGVSHPSDNLLRVLRMTGLEDVMDPDIV